MCFSAPSIPSAPAAPQSPTPQDPAVMSAIQAERLRQAQSQGGGMNSTLLTGGQGAAPAAITPKSLLGQ